MKKIICILVLLMTIPAVGFTAETYNSVYVEGRAPIIIDGDLSDWSFVSVEPNQITGENSEGISEGDSDLSASFRCFYDKYKLFIAVSVTDDNLVFGNEIYGWSWGDDSVEILFDGDLNETSKAGYDENDGQIRISADKNGNTTLEGMAMFCWRAFPPYMWETLGVSAALRQNVNGYTVEVSIPYKILGWSSWEKNRRIGLDFRVFDDDDGYDFDFILQNPIWGITEWDNKGHVAFIESADVSVTDQPGKVEVIGKEIVAIVGNPDFARIYDDVFSVFRNIANKDFESAETSLTSLNDKVWARFLLGDVQFEAGKFKKSAETLSRLVSESPDRNAVLRMARYNAGRAYMKSNEKVTALDEFGAVLSSAVENQSSLEFIHIVMGNIAENIMNEDEDSPVTIKKDAIIGQFVESYIEKMDVIPEDSSNLFRIVWGLESVQAYSAAIKFLEKIVQTNTEKEIQLKAKVEIARNYFYLGDYDRAKKLAEELFNSDVDSKTALDARMILLSIEWEKILSK